MNKLFVKNSYYLPLLLGIIILWDSGIVILYEAAVSNDNPKNKFSQFTVFQ
jgi:hypothetical protein